MVKFDPYFIKKDQKQKNFYQSKKNQSLTNQSKSQQGEDFSNSIFNLYSVFKYKANTLPEGKKFPAQSYSTT